MVLALKVEYLIYSSNIQNHDDNLDVTRKCSISKSVSFLIQCTFATSGLPFVLMNTTILCPRRVNVALFF